MVMGKINTNMDLISTNINTSMKKNQVKNLSTNISTVKKTQVKNLSINIIMEIKKNLPLQ